MGRNKGKKGRKGRALDGEAQLVPEVDLYDVWHWFAKDPAACVADVGAQRVLRAYENPYRPWTPSDAFVGTVLSAVARQDIPWWQDLRKEFSKLVEKGVPDSVADTFADYLAGYTLVCEMEPLRGKSGREVKDRNARANWRRLKRYAASRRCRKVFGAVEPPMARPPHRENLRSRLVRLMTEALIAHGFKRGFDSKGKVSAWAGDVVAAAWQVQGTKIKPASADRIERRSRRRIKLTK